MTPSLGAEAARAAALRLIDRMRRTHSDIARRLRDKGYAPEDIDPLLERLTEVGLIDDVEYARAYLAGRWGRRAAGWRKLEMDLRKRGVSPEDIAAGRAKLEAAQGAADEVGMARRAIEQAERRYAKLDPQARKRRLWGLLVRRGFSTDIIMQAMKAEVVVESFEG